ncbi:hemolysin [Lentibacillus sp. N15]|uniref:hemolysin n=1 Tax=Lentibacillus songyuanensis TaxID=3136161 RepID=UPI0031B9FA8D
MLKIINEIVDYIDERAVKADYTINGKTYPAKIRRSLVKGNTLRKHIYLTHKDPTGTVTRARLLDEDGGVVAERNDSQEHEENKGLLLEFKITIQEV